MEYPEHMLSWQNKKSINTFGLKKHLIKSYANLFTMDFIFNSELHNRNSVHTAALLDCLA